MYKRTLPLSKLLQKNNYFLFGPRATGKTTLIKSELKSVLYFNLLEDQTYEDLLRRPSIIGERARRPEQVIVIDEIQKLPKLLDEVHDLIVKTNQRFLLTGSSARKLKREGANMLGGRAREAQLFPLTFQEISNFDLLKYLNYGGLPIVYQSEEPIEDLKAYVRLYLLEEIKKEAAVRNYERFVRFLDVMALSNGKEINYARLSSDSGVPARTIEGHIEVLKDTLIGYELLPYSKTLKRKATTHSKFFFFDTGVSNFLKQVQPLSENQAEIGESFEQFIIQEVRAYLSYFRKNQRITYWRTRTHEVDLVIGDEIAIEIKFSKTPKEDFFRGLRALKEEGLVKTFILIGRFAHDGVTEDGLRYLHWKSFLQALWEGQLL